MSDTQADAPRLTPGPDVVEVRDPRSGRTLQLPVLEGVQGDRAIRALDLRQLKASDADFGLMSYDPGLMNTATCRSAITYIDGDRGILRYRGYPIEQLAEGATFLEVAWLLRHGELPSQDEYEGWVRQITAEAEVPGPVRTLLGSFGPHAHPMTMLTAAVAALASFDPRAREVGEPEAREQAIVRLLAQVPTVAALIARQRRGLPPAAPRAERSYVERFLALALGAGDGRAAAPPVFTRALEALFILHADHEQNCSTNAVRAVGSSHADPYAAVAAGIAALSGPLHGGANEQVLRMITEIGHPKHVPAFVEEVKRGRSQRLMGFGHRVYKSYDPRARLVKRLAHQVFAEVGADRDLDIALELERIALSDEYFIARKLYPNVDFYTGLIYRSMGFATDYFTVLFAVARVAGWLAQWEEMLLDPEQKIVRPRQLYVGPREREYRSRLTDPHPALDPRGTAA